MKEEQLKNINFTSLNEDEKRKLKKKIIKNASFLNKMKQRFRYGIGVAASISLIISITLYYQNYQSFSVDKYVKTANGIENEKSDKVKLILNNGEDIEIVEDNSTIKYSNTGQQINIGNSKAIEQPILKKDEIAYNTVIVPYGKRSQIQLSDGSTVWLNSGTKLVYPRGFSKNKREVYLEGEATFNITHDKNRPFVVVADNHQIEVLGTVFNVSNYKDENSISTVLKSGSVQISYKGNSLFKSKEVLKIIPGTLAVYDKKAHEINTKKVDVEKYFSWIEGELIFKNDNLKLIMKRLSRYYNVDIIINNENVENQTFSGALDLKETVEEVIKMIKETSNFEFNLTNENKIIIN
ncbi:MAG: FecR domain-containing protein [Lutibacter sp.]|uniref:FecR family protein n=1 Tax=Lutibacter sp. TaxID=1925666 RepID=UPI00385CCC96